MLLKNIYVDVASGIAGSLSDNNKIVPLTAQILV